MREVRVGVSLHTAYGGGIAAAAAEAAAGRHDSREPHAASKHKITPNDVPLRPRWI